MCVYVTVCKYVCMQVGRSMFWVFLRPAVLSGEARQPRVGLTVVSAMDITRQSMPGIIQEKIGLRKHSSAHPLLPSSAPFTLCTDLAGESVGGISAQQMSDQITQCRGHLPSRVAGEVSSVAGLN